MFSKSLRIVKFYVVSDLYKTFFRVAPSFRPSYFRRADIDTWILNKLENLKCAKTALPF